jgi:cytochrome c oxidase subunit 2
MTGSIAAAVSTMPLVPAAGSEHAAALDAVLWAVHVHLGIQAAAWGAFFVYCLVRFRQKRHPVASHAGVSTLIPAVAIGAVIVGDAVLLATTALPAWWERTAAPPVDRAPLEIRVVAEQFAWNIHYPGPDGRLGLTRPELIGASNPLGIDRRDEAARDDIGLLNQLMLPLGRPIVVQLTSRDVVHSFTLNEMRVRQDATPGLVVRTWFTPIRTGRWEIACSQLCGLGHYRMRGEYAVLTAEEWDQWLQTELSLIPRR